MTPILDLLETLDRSGVVLQAHGDRLAVWLGQNGRVVINYPARVRNGGRFRKQPWRLTADDSQWTPAVENSIIIADA
jgi:hypothetical protein